MPANLTPDYLAAERRFREATTTAQKVAALQEMLAVIPKHKGTDHLRGDLKRRLARLRQELQQRRSHGGREALFLIERHGAGQIALLGTPSSGKSSLLAALTNAQPQIADYPFTTQHPQPGMMPYKDVQIQLVDTPPLTADFMEPWLADLTRRADAVAIVVDLATDDALEQVQAVREQLARRHLLVGRPAARDAQDEHATRCPALIVGNKMDLPGAPDRLAVLRDLLAGDLTVLGVSSLTGEGLERLRTALFDLLGLVRVYTKVPGRKPDLDTPYILSAGSTVLDLAGLVHKDLQRQLKSARIWGGPDSPSPAGSAKYPGQAVERDHILADGDVIELHR
ncbi:MAG: 50S ribosome-binding GTPase [Armatimonadetes bacterium]|nr:50S ribosome-binding GTPase [Armatimonadota bacterium]